MSKRVTIIGGGVIGLCCAWWLRQEGCEVTVIEKGTITDGTSFGNAGYVSPSHFIPLASPGIVAKGLRWMLSSSSPFYIKPRLNADLIRWCLLFWKNANEATMKRNIPPLNNIPHLSRELTLQLKNDLGNHFRMVEAGCFMLYQSAATEKHEQELANQAADLGIETKILSGQAVQDLEPDTAVTVRGGVLYPIDCHLHPGDFMQTLKKRLETDGVKFQLETEVQGFERTAGTIESVITDKGKFEFDELVIASGSWLPLLSAKLGLSIPLQAGKGYSITYPGRERNLRHPAILVDHRVAMTPMGTDLRMGGTMEISGINKKILVKRVKAIFNAAGQYYPGLGLEFPSTDRIWSGLRPLTPDGLPYIGRPVRYNNLIIAGGHAMLGLSLAAATGKLVAEMAVDKTTTMGISAFSPDRFG